VKVGHEVGVGHAFEERLVATPRSVVLLFHRCVLLDEVLRLCRQDIQLVKRTLPQQGQTNLRVWELTSPTIARVARAMVSVGEPTVRRPLMLNGPVVYIRPGIDAVCRRALDH
jgi:hypothetical protein